MPALPDAGAGRRALVIDTNVVLDLLVFSDPRTDALRAQLAAHRWRWIATQAIRDELACVLGYAHLQPRIASRGQTAEGLLAQWDAGAALVPEAPRAPYVCKDADDQKFIDLAAAHGALLLSKDKAVLKLRRRLQRVGADVEQTFSA